MEFSLGINVYTVSDHHDRVRILDSPETIIHVLVYRYGNLVPRTKWGKIVTMLYAVCGIPVYILYFKNMGKVGLSKHKPYQTSGCYLW